MQLRNKVKAIELWEHVSHYVTLGLVAIALITSFFSTTAGAETELGEALHYLHLAALTLAFLHVSLLLLFSRNVGKEVAGFLAQTASPLPQPTSASPEKKYHYRALPVLAGTFEFVTAPTSTDATILLEMNREGFEGSAFEMTTEELKTRNIAFIEKNPKVFMLVRNPLLETQDQIDSSKPGAFVGFSCVLPLNDIGADYYLNGLVKDKNVRASLLCKEGEPCSTILMFSIALDKKYRKTKNLAAQYYPFLLRYAEHHINAVATAHPSAGPTTVWAQAEHKKLEQHFENRGFTHMKDKKSGNGYDLYSRLLK